MRRFIKFQKTTSARRSRSQKNGGASAPPLPSPAPRSPSPAPRSPSPAPLSPSPAPLSPSPAPRSPSPPPASRRVTPPPPRRTPQPQHRTPPPQHRTPPPPRQRAADWQRKDSYDGIASFDCPRCKKLTMPVLGECGRDSFCYNCVRDVLKENNNRCPGCGWEVTEFWEVADNNTWVKRERID